MNHIYKSIFNKALGVFTAVPEFASAHGKGSERTVVGRVAKGTAGFAASALAISVGLALTSTSAVAGPGIYINDGKSDDGCLALPDASGPNVGIYGISNTGGGVGVAILAPGQVAPNKDYFAMNAMAPCRSSGNAAQALDTQTNRTLFYGNDSYGYGNITNNGAKNLTLGGRLDVNSGIIGVGDRGTNGTGATNSIRMGTGTTLDEANKVANSISIGVDAGASALGSTAIGANAKARAEYSVALGDSAVSGDNTIGAANGGGGAIAIGRQSMANNYNAIAIGFSASVSPAAGVTTASDGIAIGSETVVDNYKGIAVGAYSQAKGRQSTVIANNVQGSNYSTASGDRSQVYGVETTVSGNNSVAIGDKNNVESDRTYAIGNNINAPTGTQNSLAFGTRASVGGASSIAMGLDSKTNTDGSIAMGLYSEAGGPITNGKPGINATAIGTEAKALGLSAVAMGYRATVENGHDSIAIGVAAKSTNKKSTAIGTLSEASGEQSTVISNNFDAKSGQSISIASGRRSQIYGSETTVSGEQSVAIGDTNTVASARTYAIGNNINVAAGADDSLVFGTKANVSAANAIAMGSSAKARTDKSVALGENALAGDPTAPTVKKGEYSTAIGSSTSALGYGATAVGSITKAKVNYATALGHEAEASGTGETSLGYGAGANSTSANGNRNGVNVGTNAGRYAISGGNNVAVGISAGQYVEGDNNIAQGYSAGYYIKGNENVSIGTNANVGSATEKLEVSKTVAIGSAAKASANNAAAMGTQAAASGSNSAAIGLNSKATTDGSIAIGTASEAGGPATDPTLLGTKAIAIGYETKALGTSNVALGYGSVAENGHDSVAIGIKAKTSNKKSTAIGAYSEASGEQSTVISNNFDSKGGQAVSVASGTRSQVYGAETNVSGNNSVAIGDKNTVASDRTYAMGNNINVAAGADDSLVFGTRAAVGAANTVAIGANANAAQANSVALGAGSATSAAQTTGPYTLNGSYTAAGQPNAANGTVSVGSAGKERQIQNVAAGVISATSTDAINGSQLYATNNYLSNLAGGVKNVLGGDAAVDNAGNLTMSNIGGTGKGNVNDAIAAANTKVAAGDNITVTPTTNTDGSKTYTVATKKDLVVDSVKAGDTTVNTDGVTIANGPSVKKDGINAGDKKITGVANGNVAAGSTDAVNGGQLAEVKAKADSAVQNVVSTNPTALTATKAGDTVTLTPNVIAGDLVNPATGAVNTPAAGDAGKLVTAGTVANALANTHFVVDTAKTDGELDAASKHDQKIKSGNKVTLQAGKNLKAKQTNAADGATVEFSLKDSISLTQVTAGTGDNQVVLGNNGVQVGGNTYINKDGLNANSKPISNVADGVKPKDAVNKGQLDAVAQEAAKHTTVKAGKNVEVTEVNNAAGGKEYTVKTADNLNVTSVKAGDSTLNTDGLTIAGGPSVKKDGINAGNKKITGVANGNVAAGSTDAVNGGQLAEVKSKADSAVQNVVSANPTALTATKAGDTVTLTPNFIAGDLVNADGTINAPAAADEGKLVSAKAVADALKANHFVVDTKANGGTTEAGSEADAKVGSSNKVTFEAGKNLVAKQANTANGGATVKFSLQDDISLNSVTAGTGANQVVLGNDGVKVGGNTYINNDGLNANDKKITNVAPGAVTPTSKDAVNGGQLYDVAKNVADLVGPDAKIDPATGKVSVADPTQGIGGTGKDNIGDAIKAVNATAAKHTTVVEGKNVKVTKGKNAAGGDEYTVATKDDLEVTSVTAGNTTVNTNGLTITGGPSVTRGGIDAGNRVISGVRAGDVSANSQEAVNGSQLHATNTKLDGVKAKADTAVQDVKSGDENALSAVKDPNTNIVTVTPKLSGDLVDADGNITAPATPADKGKLVTAGTVAQALANTHFVVDTKATDGELDAASQADQKIKAGNKVTLQAGKNLKAKQTNAADGATVEFSLKDSISLTQVTAGEGDNQVVLGNDGVKVGGNTYINKDGLNANNKPISNVADGVKPTDAVNKGQLDAVKGVADSAVKSVDVANGEQNLVVDNADPKNPKLSLKKDLTVDSVKAGDSTLNTDGLTIAGGPSVKKDGIDAGDKKITNVAPGAVTPTSKDAVNGSQLYNVADNVKDLIGPDATIDPATGKVTVADPAQGIAGTGKGTIGEAIKSVKDKADTAVQDIKSGDEKALSVTKAGNTYTITPNLSGDLVDADGNITAPATDADKGKLVTAGTVAQALANTHFVVDTKATDGELDAASEADQKVKAGNKVTLQAGKNLKAKQTNGANGAQVEFSLKDSISLTQVTAGEGDNQVVLGNDGVKVGGNTYINNAGLNANGNKITNVADGVDPTDAVNKGQLDAVKGIADSAVKSVDVANGEQNLVVDNSDPKNPKLSLKKDLTVDSVKAGDSTLNTDGLTIAGGPSVKKDGINAGDKTITNVAPGAVTPTSKDAVNGGQLYNVANNVKDLIGPDATIDPATGKVTVADPAKGIGETGKGNIGDAIKHVNDAAKAAADTAKKHTTVEQGDNIVVEESTNANGGKHYKVSTAKDLNVDSVKAGDTTVNNDGVTIAGGPSVTKGGINAGGNTITNVADGVDAADAVNKGQLDKVDTKVSNVAQNVVNVLGGDATVNGNGDITMSNIGETGKGNINDAIKSVNDLAKKAAAEKTSVKAKEGRSNVTVTEGVNAAGGHEYTVDVERSVTNAGSDYVTVTNNHDADSNTTTYTVDVSAKTKASLAKADSAVQGLTSKDGNLNFTKGANGNVEVSFNDNLNVKNVTTDRVQVANGPSMSKDGINAAGKAISNVANGNVAADSKDAVNGGQLHETAKSVADVIGGGATVKDGKVVAGQNGIGNTGQNTVHGAIAAINQNTANNFNQIRGDLRKMDRDLRGGIAGALATAGLPQAFRPGKSMVAAAASTYRGQSGLAIGVSRISDNGKVILKVTGNTNSRGDFGGTIGAGYQW